MIRHRTLDEARRFDLFKIVVLALLIVLALLLTIRARLSAQIAPTIISPTERAELPQGPLTLTGAGEPGTEIEVLNKAAVIGRAQVGADGGWSFALTPTEGAHEFSARRAGNAVATSSIIHVVVGSPPPVAAATAAGAACTGGPGVQIGQSYLVGPCDTLTFISKRTGISLQALLAANPQIKNPDLILIGQTIRLP